MSGAEENGDRLDMRAGEYVLGLLDAAAARELEAEARTNEALATAITDWRARLEPLADLPEPVAPSDMLWPRIENGLPTPASAPAIQPARQPPAGLWRPLALSSLAVAAALAVFVWFKAGNQAPAPWAQAVALLTAPGSVQAAVRAQVTSAHMITVVPLAQINTGAGRQLGFWAWPKGAPEPILLGMIRPEGGQLHYPFGVQDGTPVMITSEPASGVGRAPGPTLYIGLLAATL